VSKREQKTLVVDSLSRTISECSIGILTDYRGLSTPEMTILRRKLRESGIDYKVVKNTLARFAAERAGKEGLANLFQGPVAIALGHGEPTEPARALYDYIQSSKASLSIKGGFLADRLLTAKEVIALSELPTREVLLAKAIGGMQAPILALVTCLTAPMRGVMGVLQARIQQLEAK